MENKQQPKMETTWTYRKSASNSIDIIDTDENVICEITRQDDIQDEEFEIANIISAAPQMLEALKLVQMDYTLNLTMEAKRKINDAIFKATV